MHNGPRNRGCHMETPSTCDDGTVKFYLLTWVEGPSLRVCVGVA